MRVIDLTITNAPQRTKDRILLESARMFATRGYDAVSVRDIGEAVNVNAGSIYTHYESKQAVLDAILEKCDDLLEKFFSGLEGAAKEAGSMEEILSLLFADRQDDTALFTYYGISILQDVYTSYDKAREIYYRQMLHGGRDRLKQMFDAAITRGLCNRFDTAMTAQLIMSLFTTFNGLQVAESQGIPIECNIADIYSRAQNYFLNAIEAGV